MFFSSLLRVICLLATSQIPILVCLSLHELIAIVLRLQRRWVVDIRFVFMLRSGIVFMSLIKSNRLVLVPYLLV